MKHLKKWAAVLLCAALVFTLSVPALAGDGFMNEGTFYNYESATFVNNGPFQNNGTMHNEGAFSNLGRLFGDGLAKWLKPMTANSGRNEMAAPKGNLGAMAWTISEGGQLSITGSGALPAYPSGQNPPWMKYYTLITDLTIADSVTGISEGAFFNMNYLGRASLGTGATQIGDWAFGCCYSLTDVVIPSGVTSIGNYAFITAGLKNVSIPAGVTAIGTNAFYGCEDLRVSYGGTAADFAAVSLNPGSFHDGTVITTADTAAQTITAVNGVTTAYTDSTASGGASVTLNGTRYFYAEAAAGTTATYITDVNYYYDLYLNSDGQIIRYVKGRNNSTPAPSSGGGGNVIVASGTCGADSDGSNLTWTLNTAGTLTISGTGAMADYTNPNVVPWAAYSTSISGVILNSGITHIGDCAFNGCNTLTKVEVPSSVTSVGNAAFASCNNLANVHYRGTIAQWNTHIKPSITVSDSEPLSSITTKVYFNVAWNEPLILLQHSTIFTSDGYYIKCVADGAVQDFVVRNDADIPSDGLTVGGIYHYVVGSDGYISQLTYADSMETVISIDSTNKTITTASGTWDCSNSELTQINMIGTADSDIVYGVSFDDISTSSQVYISSADGLLTTPFVLYVK